MEKKHNDGMRRILQHCVVSQETLTPQSSLDGSARLDSGSSSTKVDAPSVLALQMHLSMHREERRLDPWWHYARLGLLFTRLHGSAPEEARRSAAAAAAYLVANPDVADVGCEAWWHYVNFGRREGRTWGSQNESEYDSGYGQPRTSPLPDIEQGGGTE